MATTRQAGEWQLIDEDRESFYCYPMVRSRLTGRMRRRGFNHARYFTFKIVRRWYSSVTREFSTTEEVIRTVDETLAEGYAIFDWRNSRYIYPETS